MTFICESVDPVRFKSICTKPIYWWGVELVPTDWATDEAAGACFFEAGYDRDMDIRTSVLWWRNSFFHIGLRYSGRVIEDDQLGRALLVHCVAPVQLPPEMAGAIDSVPAMVEAALLAQTNPLKTIKRVKLFDWAVK